MFNEITTKTAKTLTNSSDIQSKCLGHRLLRKYGSKQEVLAAIDSERKALHQSKFAGNAKKALEKLAIEIGGL